MSCLSEIKGNGFPEETRRLTEQLSCLLYTSGSGVGNVKDITQARSVPGIVHQSDSLGAAPYIPARLYKYPFHEQLMIYAQRPDATACAEYDLWNEKRCV